MSVLTAEQHDQHTVWKDGIDVEECWPWCRVCKINALREALIADRAFIDVLAGHGLGNAIYHQKHHPIDRALLGEKP